MRMQWWLSCRRRVAVWLYALAAWCDPNLNSNPTAAAAALRRFLIEQTAIAWQLQGVDDEYRVRRVLYKARGKFSSFDLASADVFVRMQLALAPPRPVTIDPAAESAQRLPSHLRRHRAS